VIPLGGGWGLEVFTDAFERAFFNAGDLRLRNTDLVCNLHLRFSSIKTHRDDGAFAVGKLFHRFGDGDVFKP
jgi:hypothetical protein